MIMSHIFCADVKPENALVHDEAPRGEFPPVATKSIIGDSGIPQLLQYFVVSTICTPHFGQNISIAPGFNHSEWRDPTITSAEGAPR
jgi:hypothetical protein